LKCAYYQELIEDVKLMEKKNIKEREKIIKMIYDFSYTILHDEILQRFINYLKIRFGLLSLDELIDLKIERENYFKLINKRNMTERQGFKEIIELMGYIKKRSNTNQKGTKVKFATNTSSNIYKDRDIKYIDHSYINEDSIFDHPYDSNISKRKGPGYQSINSKSRLKNSNLYNNIKFARTSTPTVQGKSQRVKNTIINTSKTLRKTNTVMTSSITNKLKTEDEIIKSDNNENQENIENVETPNSPIDHNTTLVNKSSLADFDEKETSSNQVVKLSPLSNVLEDPKIIPLTNKDSLTSNNSLYIIKMKKSSKNYTIKEDKSENSNTDSDKDDSFSYNNDTMPYEFNNKVYLKYSVKNIKNDKPNKKNDHK
jgi:hypothetical protein